MLNTFAYILPPSTSFHLPAYILPPSARKSESPAERVAAAMAVNEQNTAEAAGPSTGCPLGHISEEPERVQAVV